MTFDEFNKHTHEITMAYRELVKWNEWLREQRDEARKLAEEWRNEHCGDCYDDRPDDERLPWEEK